ncbi:ABC transporter permease [Sphaerisporangium siamense]|uniref:ABC-2 type transport system permease protein n=1 Tax=Sphaerisporangium siamense TaxID=795645 RepID=A0A7W7GC80_9ACTN|nr:ABC transporter permease [Sphaerisporangium siamense]MBB4704287.1 ABC-2 type transport system permease protein [Sphaerisporangium siamense]GII85032.1 ABC transporter permease [Sphaerisporangium siamense]
MSTVDTARGTAAAPAAGDPDSGPVAPSRASSPEGDATGSGAPSGASSPEGEAAGSVAGRAAGPGAGASWAGRSGLRLLGSEVRLTFRRPRNIAMLGALAVVPVVIGVVLRLVGADDDAPSLVTQVAGNGLMLTFVSMSLLTALLLPVAVGVVAGESVAGEAGAGTLRYLLTAPAGRARLLGVKAANVVVFALAACTVVAVSGLVIGLVLFPVGPVTLLSGTTVPLADGLLRLLIVTGYAAAGMAAFGIVGLALSTFTEVPIGAVAATVVTVVFSQVAGAIPQLDPVRPYLLTSWWSSFDGALRDPVATDVMGQGLLVFAAYAFVFGAIAWGRFSGRDITS